MTDETSSTPKSDDAQLSASFFSKARIAARGIASMLRPAPTAEGGAPDVISPDTLRERRVPRGQVETKRWPILHAGPTPRVDLSTWSLALSGLVDRPISWSWQEFRSLPSSRVFADMHCVTRWSMLNNTWEGVLVSEVMKHVSPQPDARFVLIRADGGYSTNLPLVDFLGEDCLFAWSHNGRDLEPDHGGPLRLVVPRLYAWKSAKWVRGVEFRSDDTPGFWEENGYHNHGDPWTLNAKGTDSAERFW
jgi:DMSO/TMAO reductase YedYZ molybdopterin-dependent catalytic subunit